MIPLEVAVPMGFVGFALILLAVLLDWLDRPKVYGWDTVTVTPPGRGKTWTYVPPEPPEPY